MPLPRFGRTGPRPDDTVRAVAESLVRRLTFELVPMRSAGPATDDLPAATRVSVTCSATKGIAATLDSTAI